MARSKLSIPSMIPPEDKGHSLDGIILVGRTCCAA